MQLSKTRLLIESFKYWNTYDLRSRKDKANHLRWCRAAFGLEKARENQLKLWEVRYRNYRNYLQEQVAETGY